MQWSPEFEVSFLGTVKEHCELASGFGGIVRAGWLGDVEVVTKELHHDPEKEAFFKELYFGLLIPASPCVGFAQASDGTIRLVAARLQETVAQFLSRGNWPFTSRKKLALGILSAVNTLANLGLAHCDFKADNLMIDNDVVFIIDFGSVSLEGGTPPMSCQKYRPPDTVVTPSWDIYSLGEILAEAFGNTCPEMLALHGQICCGFASRRPSLQNRS